MKKMKTKWIIGALTFVLLSGAAISSTAQDRRMGVKGGLNLSNLYVDNVDDENARIGFHLGVYGQIFSTETFAIQPELLYTTKGTEIEWDGTVDQTIDFNLNYLELPVLAVFKLGDAAEIHAGPYFGYLLGANMNTEGDLGGTTEDLDRDNFNSLDFGLTGGFGLNFGAVQVGARYNFGLSEIADSDTAELLLGDAKNSCAQLYVALNLNP